MPRLTLLAPALGALLLAACAASDRVTAPSPTAVPARSAVHDTTSRVYSEAFELPAWDPCNDHLPFEERDFVLLKGTTRVVYRPGMQDAGGGMHLHVKASTHAVGVGDLTGRSYTFNNTWAETANMAADLFGGYTGSTHSKLRIVAQGATANWDTTIRTQMTFDANGNLRLYRFVEKFECSQ